MFCTFAYVGRLSVLFLCFVGFFLVFKFLKIWSMQEFLTFFNVWLGQFYMVIKIYVGNICSLWIHFVFFVPQCWFRSQSDFQNCNWLSSFPFFDFWMNFFVKKKKKKAREFLSKQSHSMCTLILVQVLVGMGNILYCPHCRTDCYSYTLIK